MCITGVDKISLGSATGGAQPFSPQNTFLLRAEIANDIHGEIEPTPLTIIDLIGRVCTPRYVYAWTRITSSLVVPIILKTVVMGL